MTLNRCEKCKCYYQSRKCPKCNIQLDKGWKDCRHCGWIPEPKHKEV